MRLNGKVAVITGGGTGIGRGTAVLFAKEGAKVMIAGRREEPLKETVETIRSNGGSADYIVTDISKSEQVKKLFEETEKKYGKIDILFNNAAVFTGNGNDISELEEDDWDELMDINLKAQFLCSKYVIPCMRKNKGGSIVFTSSISAFIAQKKHVAYNTSKGGIEMMMKCMALDFAKENIRVNSVCPAWVEPDLESFRKNHGDKEAEEITNLHPIGRLGTPEDIAYAVLYLASDESSWVTGTSLIIDGGYTLQ